MMMNGINQSFWRQAVVGILPTTGPGMLGSRSLLAFGLLVLIGVIPAFASSMSLVLRPEAQVSSRQIVIGDVLVSTRGIPPEVLSLSLGSTPTFRDVRPISRDMIEIAVRTQLKSEVTFNWMGSELCQVTRPSRFVSAADLTAVLLPALAQATGNVGQFSLDEFGPLTPMQIPMGRAKAEVELNPTATTNTWTNAKVSFWVDGENVLSRSIRFRWSWTRDGWVAQRSLTAGTSLTINDFTSTKVNALQAAGLITDSTLSSNHTLAKAIQPGQVLTSAFLQAKKVVQRGEQVMVHYKASGFKVSMQGVAMEDGVQGASIPVMNASSRKRVLAKVMSDHNLEFVQQL